MVIRYALIAGLLLMGIVAASDADGLFADRLYDKGEYGWAFLEYERLIFTHPDTNALSSWHYRCGKCLMHTDRYNEAGISFSRVPPGNRYGDSASLQAALCALHLKKTGVAATLASACRLDYAKIVGGYIDFLSSRYTVAIDTLKNVAVDSPDAFRARALEKTVSEAATFKKKSFTPALMLSIAPGLGHLYSGNNGDAAMTAITIATGALITGYYAYHSSQYRAVAAGTVTGLLYAGSMYGAVLSVKIYNRNHLRTYRETAERIVFGK
jgi:hypothetical protein